MSCKDIDTLSRYDPVKRLALALVVACLVHTARMRARDDLAEMLCKRWLMRRGRCRSWCSGQVRGRGSALPVSRRRRWPPP